MARDAVRSAFASPPPSIRSAAPGGTVRRLTLFAALAALSACTTRVLPLSAQAGSSVAVAIGGDASQGDFLGYGGAWLADAGIEDDQRGELVFALVPASGPERSLRTLFVTRTFPDPASEAALTDTAEPDALYPLGLAQTLVVLEIPADTPPGRYRVDARRRRRAPGGGFTELPAPMLRTELDVLPAVVGGVAGRPNRPELAIDANVVDLGSRLPRVVPHPKLVLAFASGPPAAAHLVLDYPPRKLEIRGAFEEQHTGRRSMLAWRDDPVAGRLTIDFVDPAASVSALAVAFRLRDPTGTGIAAPGDFRIAQTVLYDASGAVAAGSVRLGAIR